METEDAIEVSPEYAQATNTAPRSTRTSTRSSTKAARREHRLSSAAHRPAARRRAARILSDPEGEDVTWAFSLPGFWPARRPSDCRSGFTCCANTAARRMPFSSLMFFERRTQSSIKHRRLRYLLAALAARRSAAADRAGLRESVRQPDRCGAAGGRKMLVHRGRQFVQHALRRSSGARQTGRPERGLEPASRRARRRCWRSDSRVHFLTQPVEEADAAQGRHPEPSSLPTSTAPTANSPARCAPSRNPRTFRSKCIWSATCRNRRCRRLSPTCACGSDTNLVFHSVADAKEPNWMVESVTAPGQDLRSEESARAGRRSPAYGTPASQTHGLAGAGWQGAGKQSRWTFPPTAAPRVEFLSLDSPHGFHKGEIRIEPGDSLHEDDRFAFRHRAHRSASGAVPASRRRRIATCSTTAPRSNRSPKPASYSNRWRWSRPPINRSRNTLSSSCPTSAHMPAGSRKQPARYVRGGGSLLVALGPRSAALTHVPVSGEADPGLQLRVARRRRAFKPSAAADAEHPALRRANKLDGVQFYQVIKVDPGQSRVIARLTNQTPLLLEKQVGEGRVFVFTSTFDNISNDLPLHASFVPFVEETRPLSGRPAGTLHQRRRGFLHRSALRQGPGRRRRRDRPGRHASAVAQGSHHARRPSR